MPRIIEKETKDRRGMVMKPNQSMNMVEQDTPSKQGLASSGIISKCNKL